MAKVTSKLQVTIPKAIAEQYGIKPGDEIEFRPSLDKEVAIIFRSFSAKYGMVYEHILSPGNLDIPTED